MALTANRELNRYVDQELRLYRVLGGAHVFKGAFVGLDRASGFVRPLESGDAFAGIAYEEADNSGGADGERSVRVFTQGDFPLALAGATVAAIGRPVFVGADDVLTVNISGGVAYAGKCVDVPGLNTAIVRIEPFQDGQVLRSAEAPLASSTAGATVNPVMITVRPIFIYAAEVVFNTKPDAGLLDVGTDDSDPDEIVDAFNLAGLTDHLIATPTLAGVTVAGGRRIWAKVGQAGATAGVGGLLVLRYIELP